MAKIHSRAFGFHILLYSETYKYHHQFFVPENFVSRKNSVNLHNHKTRNKLHTLRSRFYMNANGIYLKRNISTESVLKKITATHL